MEKGTKKKMKLKVMPIVFIVQLLILFAMIGFLGYKVYDEFFSNKESTNEPQIEEKDKMGNYAYYLKDRDTQLFVTEYESLKKVLNESTVDYEKYAQGIVKLFIIDFYTLNNKFTSTDIGGLDYIHSDALENFKLNAGRTMYKGIKSNLYGDRVQDLPVVSSVTIESSTPSTYIYNDASYDSYIVKATWTYETDLGYETSGEFVVIKVNDIMNIVSVS